MFFEEIEKQFLGFCRLKAIEARVDVREIKKDRESSRSAMATKVSGKCLHEHSWLGFRLT